MEPLEANLGLDTPGDPMFKILLITACLALPLVPSSPEPPSRTSAQGEGTPRDFDFWVGDWVVESMDGTPAGTNVVTLEYGDRVLIEHWTGSGGGTGTSLNSFDAPRGVWHQTWMDGSGTVLLLDGGLDEEGRMRLAGTRPGQGGGTVHHEIAWTPEEGGTVRQTWRARRDGSDAWKVLADLRYVRREPESPGRASDSTPEGEGGGLEGGGEHEGTQAQGSGRHQEDDH